jgi:quercetin dioxygenase-like cupin family protein
VEKVNLNERAKLLPEAWRSVIVAKPGGANLKVLRMGGSVSPDETHDSVEALIVLEGKLNLQVAGKTISIGSGEAFIVPPGQSHSVGPGSHGTLIIIDA